MSGSPTLLWFRQDLRLQDNPALAAAIERGEPIIPVFIFDEGGEGAWPLGGASRWWLHGSLAALDESLVKRGLRLVIAHGQTAVVLDELIEKTGAGAVFWNRRYEPASIARDTALKADLGARGIEVRSFNAGLLFEPQTIANKQGRPFQVFTPYWRHCLALPSPAPVVIKAGVLPAPTRWPSTRSLESLQLRPSIPWDRGFHDTWTPGENGARKRLDAFLAEAVADYGETRDIPSVDGVSKLSPHLHFGEIGPRQIWAAAAALGRDRGVFPANFGVAKFLAEVGWREFAHHLLFHFPHTPEEPLRTEFARFPWREDPDGQLLRAWQRGQTGYPIVDAGMRQLWTTGWMHNRVRMIVASFLVKHLRLSWVHGARWFWNTLVDADLASNTLGWQWSAGCGADAAPYFRIFAPVLQGEKFDGEGGYVRRWCPELARLPARCLHQPWTAPAAVLLAAGVRLGESYPRPIVDHATARAEALRAFQSLRA
jgi:deoxyribodipyrimidine photo-lyase